MIANQIQQVQSTTTDRDVLVVQVGKDLLQVRGHGVLDGQAAHCLQAQVADVCLGADDEDYQDF